MISTLGSLLLLGCEQPVPDVAGPLKPPEESGEVLLADAHNYSFWGLLDGPSFQLEELTDPTIRWDELTEDLQCHELDGVDDIDVVGLMVFPLLDELTVEEGLSYDTLSQVDMTIFLSSEPGDDTSVSLSDFSFDGTDVDTTTYFEVGSGTWALVFSSGFTIGVGTRMLAFLEPVAAGEADSTEASVTDGCSALEYDADLTSLREVPVLPGGPWEVDWSAVTEASYGGEFEAVKVTEIMVGHYDLEREEIADNFLDLELIATELYTMDHPAGVEADLADLTDADGDPFPGFTDDGTWVFALRCKTCSNPAPLFLTTLVPWD
ncbi:MAG: hypothetical protein GY913_14105 [Proteobacteria bacterium]|nr:hypothetical protein [Pseudomonadota bacterium]MCP4918042.1 hypothetical protein [Pseudomonadota bacterium]